MAVMDYEACYAALQLSFGASLKEVNERWRKLSREHHPDRHMRDPKAYKQALEKQKQLNNARDILKTWFEANPASPPPKTHGNTTQNNSKNSSAGSQSTNNANNSGQSHSTNGHSQQSSSQSNNGQKQTHSHQHHWEHKGHSHTGASSSQGTTSDTTATWFTTSELNLTSLQKLVQKIDTFCNAPSSDSATALAMALVFAAIFGPLWILSATLGLIFPEFAGHYPDWLQAILFFAWGYVTWYIFRWYFTETEVIKLQQRKLFFRTDRSIQNSIEFVKLVIGKQARLDAQWRFESGSSGHEAILEFAEEVLPEIKRTRRLVIRFETRQTAVGAVVGVEVRATSPVNSFSCKQIAESIVVELRKHFHEVAA